MQKDMICDDDGNDGNVWQINFWYTGKDDAINRMDDNLSEKSGSLLDIWNVNLFS